MESLSPVAFADRRFAGDPAAVMPLAAFPDDATLQAIAAENGLAETAFVVPLGDVDGHCVRGDRVELEGRCAFILEGDAEI